MALQIWPIKKINLALRNSYNMNNLSCPKLLNLKLTFKKKTFDLGPPIAFKWLIKLIDYLNYPCSMPINLGSTLGGKIDCLLWRDQQVK